MCAILAPYRLFFVFLYIFMLLNQLRHNLKVLERERFKHVNLVYHTTHHIKSWNSRANLGMITLSIVIVLAMCFAALSHG